MTIKHEAEVGQVNRDLVRPDLDARAFLHCLGQICRKLIAQHGCYFGIRNADGLDHVLECVGGAGGLLKLNPARFRG